MGEPLLLIREGKLQTQNLKRARVTEDEVKMHLRINRVKQLSHVKHATLETSGDLGIELFPEHALATSKDIEEIKLALEIIAENLKIGPLFTSEKSSAQGQTSEDNLFIQAIRVQDKDPLH